jgi:hypothetical protein
MTGYDPTEAGNHGLTIEMSVTKLRERLKLNKCKLQQEIDFKRDTNLAKKVRDTLNLLEDANKLKNSENGGSKRKRRENSSSWRIEYESVG